MSDTLALAHSRNGVPIRLTYKRWAHIVEAHDYMAGLHDWVMATVAEPDRLIVGWAGSLVATRHYPQPPITDKHLIVVDRETSAADGFVITSFMTSQVERIWKRGVLWRAWS